MPIRGERGAPMFVKATPRELLHFFNDLECLFHQAAITSEALKKRYVLRYVEFKLEQGWKCFPAYANATAPYSDFRDAILVFYCVYSLRSMELLISDAKRAIISTTSQLGDYHMQFLAITSWLIKKQRLDNIDQKRSYIKAFHPSLSLAISQRLRSELPNHYSDDPYHITDVYDAAQFALSSTSPLVSPPPPVARSAVESNNSHPQFSDFTRTTVRSINQAAPNAPSTVSQPHDLVHSLQTTTIASVMQSNPSTPLHVRISVGSQRGPQQPSAMPCMSTISTSQPTASQTIAHMDTARLSCRNHLGPIYHSPTAYQLPATPEIQESELDMPITISQNQFMSLSLEGRMEIQALIAARQTRALSAPHIVPVTVLQQFGHNHLASLEPELPILRSKDQDIAGNIRTNSQDEQEVCIISAEENPAAKAADTPNCADTAYIASLPICKVPHINAMGPDSTIVLARHYNQSPQLTLARRSQSENRAAISIGLAQSAPFAPSPMLRPTFTACDYMSIYNPGSSLQSIATHIVTHNPAPTLAVLGSLQRTIYKESLASSLSNPLRPTHFIYHSISSLLANSDSSISFPGQFLNLAFKRTPKRSIPLRVIIYPPHKSLQPARFSALNDSTTASSATMSLSFSSTVRLITKTLALIYIIPARLSRLHRFLSPAIRINCPILSKRGTSIYSTQFIALRSIFNVLAHVISSMRTPIRLLHCNTSPSWLSSRIFAFAHAAIRRASPTSLKPAAPNISTALDSFMTEDSQY
jgi:hypothetical protein